VSSSPRSRVGLNLLHLVPKETGGAEIYARRLIPALLETRPALRLTLFTGREAAPALRSEAWAGDVEIVELPVRSRRRLGRVAAEQTLLARATRRARIELLHNVFTTAPFSPGVPQVTTIHDVIYKRLPETHAGVLARGLELLVPLAARRSARVIAVSEATKADLIDSLGVPAEKVDVVYEGPGIAEQASPADESEVREALGLRDERLVLTVSAKRPHKNLERLIDAFARVTEADQAVLLMPGYATPFEAALERRAAAAGIADRVRFTGWLDDRALDALYRMAACFVFPSLAEGFGLPVLEAMRRGAPVACSRAGSLPEIAGGAARYFDPLDTPSIAAAISEVLTDRALAAQLVEDGHRRAELFTWERCAAGTLDVYDRAGRT
jgi:glycosyltransferase involved in cell wall biosynthesis